MISILSLLSIRPFAASIACACVACALWGFVFLAPLLLNEVHPVIISAGRYGVYGVFALLLSLPRWRNTLHLIQSPHAKIALGLSFMSNSVYFALLSAAVQLSSPAVVGVIIGTLPVWVTLLGRKRGTPIRGLLVSLSLLTAGIALINWQALHLASDHSHEQYGLGVLLACAATVCWTAYSVLNARYLQTHPTISHYDWTNLLAFAAVVPFALLLPLLTWTHPHIFELGGQWLDFLWISSLLGIGGSWVATYLWNVGSRSLPTTLMGQLVVVETVFALIYSFAYSARWPFVIEWIAMGLCIAGVFSAVRQASQ